MGIDCVNYSHSDNTMVGSLVIRHVCWFVHPCVRVFIPEHVSRLNVLKTVGVEARLQWSTYRNWHTVNPVVT